MAYGKILTIDYWCGRCHKGLVEAQTHRGMIDEVRCNVCNRQVRIAPRTPNTKRSSRR